MSDADRTLVAEAIAGALHPVFWWAALLGVLASAAAMLMQERVLEEDYPAAERGPAE